MNIPLHSSVTKNSPCIPLSIQESHTFHDMLVMSIMLFLCHDNDVMVMHTLYSEHTQDVGAVFFMDMRDVSTNALSFYNNLLSVLKVGAYVACKCTGTFSSVNITPYM